MNCEEQLFFLQHLFFLFLARTFLPPVVSRSQCSGAARPGQLPAQARRGMRLGASPSCHRASARSSCKAGSVPAALSWTSLGNSRSDEASARWAATEMMRLHRWTQALCAAGRSAGGAFAARARASMPRKAAASGAQRPPTSTPKTTRRQRRERPSSG